MTFSENDSKGAFPISFGFAFSILIHGVVFLFAPLLMVSDLHEIGTTDSDILLSVNLVAENSDSFRVEMQEMTASQCHKDKPRTTERSTSTNLERRSATRSGKRKFSTKSISEAVAQSLPEAEPQPSTGLLEPDESHPTKQMRGSEQTPLGNLSIDAVCGGTLQLRWRSIEFQTSAFMAGPAASGAFRRKSLRRPVSPARNRPGLVSTSLSEVKPYSPQIVTAAVSHQKTVLARPVEVQVQAAPVESADEQQASSIERKPNSARPRGKFVPARPRGRNPTPSYPASAKRRQLEGMVVLAVSIDAEGKVESVTVREHSDWQLLDRAAAGAVARWRFFPASREGTSVSSVVLLPVVFQLNSDSKCRS